MNDSQLPRSSGKRPPKAAKKPESRGKASSGLGPVATIHATFTDSVERLGKDATIYGLSVLAGIVALARGQNALNVAILMGVLIVGWPTFKVGSALADKFQATDELDNALQEGDAVTEKHESETGKKDNV